MDISVITPFYRGNAYLPGLLDCIRRCCAYDRRISVELILVNDSPDCPMEAEPQACDGFSLRKLTNEQNLGIHGSRVRGLEAAQGEFVLFLDQDDLLQEQTFASHLARMDGCDVSVANGFDQAPGNYGPIYRSAAHHAQAVTPRFYCTVGNMIVSPGQCLIRRAAIPAAWCQDILKRNGSDDLLLWLLLFGTGCRWQVNPESLYTHVETGSNVSADLKKMTASSMEVLAHLQRRGLIGPRQARQYKRRFAMRSFYEGRGPVRKLLAAALWPDLALELLALNRTKRN